ncbi:RagB/SusD family nutrient uptake outer membrane protein [Mucilaginibacter aquaedulcis]|uniref:RagB/SusD family nutrient uptake outer membrane protein n=1 Tax=Mucilaginibacter aquaedulcis TaxID=1187081 RepID=UPI0025B2F74A|nr:RagB/SusD family nutrient uptake outer membrane protein [Mucilaginibacter aquaedulcis]MDN3550632.1 RagB/SusD family nutrient uptake outer membrane protein [Mucilaginibacter aquaedulcis]
MRAKIYITLSMALAIAISSCKKSLDKPLLGALETPLLETKDGVNGLLIGTYAALDGMAGTSAIGGGNPWETSPDNWVLGGVAAGDANKGSIAGDVSEIEPIMQFYSDPTNVFYNSKWKADYEGISRANTTIKVAAKVTGLTDDEKANITGQARFLRGHYYFDLRKIFKSVPYIDETTTNFNQPNNTDVWAKIEADFDFAYQNLPGTQTSVGMANKWAAGAYLAKTYLYEQKYTEAKTVFDAVILNGLTSNGLKYALNAKFDDNFTPETENSSEAVFAIQMAANVDPDGPTNGNNGDMLNFPYGTNSPFPCCGFYQPSADLVNHFRTDATGLPYLDDFNSHPIKNDMHISSSTAFTPDAGNIDPRLDWTAGRRGIPYLDWGVHPGDSWVRDQSYAGPYSPIKNVYWNATQDVDGDQHSWAPGSAINYNVIRFADVLLMAAEVEAQLGNLAKAQTYVNMVRNRAANPAGWVHTYKDPKNPTGGFTNTPAANYKVSPYPGGAFSSQAFALKAIYFERKIELAMEGHRFFDLVRWGTAETELNAYFKYQNTVTTDLRSGKYVKGKNDYFPIPQRQIDLSASGGSPVLKQNAGY